MPSNRIKPAETSPTPLSDSGGTGLPLSRRTSSPTILETVPSSARVARSVGGRVLSEDGDALTRRSEIRLMKRRKRAGWTLQIVLAISTLVSIGFLVWVAVTGTQKAYQAQQLTFSTDNVVGYSIFVPLTLAAIAIVNRAAAKKPERVRLLSRLVWVYLFVVVVVAFYSSFLFVRYYSNWEIMQKQYTDPEEKAHAKSAVVQGWIRMGAYSVIHVLLLRFLVDFIIISRKIASDHKGGGQPHRRRSSLAPEDKPK